MKPFAFVVLVGMKRITSASVRQPALDRRPCSAYTLPSNHLDLDTARSFEPGGGQDLQIVDHTPLNDWVPQGLPQPLPKTVGAGNPGLKEVQLRHDMIGESTAIRRVYDFIAKVAQSDASVLIDGENGTGKELAARAIHQNSARAQGPFIAINCATLSETLLESELFGHEKGSFTGATGLKKGKFEAAESGTIFLDEIGELEPSVQVKLLRVLQEREIERVGGTRPISIDVRLIAATNRDLQAAINEGTFRQDLYFRLNVISLTMPALRDRRDDIWLLTNYFVAKAAERARRRVSGVSEEARSLLMQYDWPGNVRELENAIERAVVMGASDRIMPADLPESILEFEHSPLLATDSYHEAVNRAKRDVVVRALERADGVQTEAAKLLEIHPVHLNRLIRRLNLKKWGELLRHRSGGPGYVAP